MSERPTPETDALERCQDIQRLQPARDFRFWHGDRLEQMRSLARKLERERDEAREQAIKAIETGLVYARECLAARDKEFFQASPSDRTWYVANALVTVEKDISEMEGLLLFLRKEGGAQ